MLTNNMVFQGTSPIKPTSVRTNTSRHAHAHQVTKLVKIIFTLMLLGRKKKITEYKRFYLVFFNSFFCVFLFHMDSCLIRILSIGEQLKSIKSYVFQCLHHWHIHLFSNNGYWQFLCAQIKLTNQRAAQLRTCFLTSSFEQIWCWNEFLVYTNSCQAVNQLQGHKYHQPITIQRTLDKCVTLKANHWLCNRLNIAWPVSGLPDMCLCYTTCHNNRASQQTRSVFCVVYSCI